VKLLQAELLAESPRRLLVDDAVVDRAFVERAPPGPLTLAGPARRRRRRIIHGARPPALDPAALRAHEDGHGLPVAGVLGVREAQRAAAGGTGARGPDAHSGAGVDRRSGLWEHPFKSAASQAQAIVGGISQPVTRFG